MAIESICAGCGNKLAVGEEHVGKRARCPACGHVYTVGQSAETQPLENSSESPADGNAFGLEDTSYAGTNGVDQVDASSGASASSPTGQTADQYWMKAADGAEYGPVDRTTLNRWFQEGRVASNYMIRQGAGGTWLSASSFQPITSPSGNPYATAAATTVGNATPVRAYPKADQGGLILAMGILSFFVCGIFGIVAWVMGHNALKDIQAGLADPSNKGLVQVGYYMGMASVILHLLCGGGYIVFIAFLIASGA